MPRVRPKLPSGALQRDKRTTKDRMRVQRVAKTKKRESWMLRRCLFILCFIGFLGNSFYNMEQYWTGSKTVSERWIQSRSKRLQLPTLTICPAESIYGNFRSKEYGKSQLEDLLDCTISKGKDCLQDLKEATEDMEVKKVNFSDHRIIYTGYHGKCFTVTPPYETSALSFLWIKVGSVPSLIYLHEPEEQFFIHLSFYPGKVPPIIEAGMDILYKTAIISKSEFKRDNSCKQWSTQDQIECLKKNIRSDYEKSELNCTSLWLNSMLDPMIPTNHLCQMEEESQELIRTIDHSLSIHMSITCPASCRQVQYDMSLESVGALSPNGTRYIFLSYSTSEIRVVKSVPLSTLNNFISNVGGNLGLFLGFSIISILIALLNCVQGKEGSESGK